MAILITGGTGYIGSHTVVELLNVGYDVVIVDNLCNSSHEVVHRIEQITKKTPAFYEIDVRDEQALDEVFSKENITDVIHFAGLKAVGESTKLPLIYYDNNLNSTIVLLKIMAKHHVHNIVFSSSATVYGNPKSVPIHEDDEVGGVTNPYGRTKVIIEEILQDLAKVHPEMNIALLRYFNPIGAHASGLIGENPHGIPNNLMPYITQVAVGKLAYLGVFGDDYKTIDGTGVRDYIHVVDLALGHVAALKKMASNPGLFIVNLGTGRGTSVLEMVHAFEKANHLSIPYQVLPRRSGDIDACYADCTKAKKVLNWEARYSIEDACRDAWNWQRHNPHGFNK